MATDSTVGAGPIPYIELIVQALLQTGVAVPVIFESIRALIGLFKKANPDVVLPTDADVIEILSRVTTAHRDADLEWLRQKGLA